MQQRSGHLYAQIAGQQLLRNRATDTEVRARSIADNESDEVSVPVQSLSIRARLVLHHHAQLALSVEFEMDLRSEQSDLFF